MQQRFYRWELKSEVDAVISKISNVIDEKGLDEQAYLCHMIQIQLMSKEPRIQKNLFQTC